MQWAVIFFIEDRQLFASSPRFRRRRGGRWYQVWLPYGRGASGRLKWLRRDADPAKREWTNEIEFHPPTAQNNVTHA
jgi:hypothetical protein